MLPRVAAGPVKSKRSRSTPTRSCKGVRRRKSQQSGNVAVGCVVDGQHGPAEIGDNRADFARRQAADVGNPAADVHAGPRKARHGLHRAGLRPARLVLEMTVSHLRDRFEPTLAVAKRPVVQVAAYLHAAGAISPPASASRSQDLSRSLSTDSGQ
jgi:hypothetical protein